MLIREWEIWDSYSTYFIDPIINMKEAAKNLVKSELVKCAFVSDGTYYCVDNSEITTGYVDITLDSTRDKALFKIKPEVPKDNLSREALFQSIYFRFAEMKQYRKNKYFPPKYIRGHMSECLLIHGNETYYVYPLIKLFETGVLLVELRLGSPNAKINIHTFVNEYINIYKINFESIMVPPALRIAGQHAYALSEKGVNPILVRIGSFLLDLQLRTYIDKNKQIRKSGDFEYEQIPLWGKLSNNDHDNDGNNEKATLEPYTISDFANTIFGAISVVIKGLKKGKSLLIKPNSVLLLGDAWIGRPHVHLFVFDKQRRTTEQNEKLFGSDFGFILAGIYIKNKKQGEKYLSANMREFDDYAAYITERGTLWAWCKKGLSQQKKWEVTNRGELIYFNQSLCELLDYGYMLYRQLLQNVSTKQSMEDILKTRDQLINLENSMNEFSGYGDIKRLINQGWKEMQVTNLKSAITDTIGVRQTEASIRKERSLTVIQIMLSIVFGTVAIPGFALEFVKPAWILLDIWKPTNPNAEQIWFFVISLVLIGVPILLINNWVKRKYYW